MPYSDDNVANDAPRAISEMNQGGGELIAEDANKPTTMMAAVSGPSFPHPQSQ